MAWILGRRRSRNPGPVWLPSPVAEELAEMAAGDPALAAALERRRDRGRRPREEVYARYGYLLFIPTNR